MVEMPASQYVEARNNGYYVAGTRISLDSVACAIGRGETLEEILADFPAIESRQKLKGAIAFINAHPSEIEAYLAEKAQRWEEARKLNPPHLGEKARRYRGKKDLRSA
jgi:uncharacterized protein (DUF433 family)